MVRPGRFSSVRRFPPRGQKAGSRGGGEAAYNFIIFGNTNFEKGFFPYSEKGRLDFCRIARKKTPAAADGGAGAGREPRAASHPARPRPVEKGDDTAMRTRKLALGSKNIVGARVTRARLAKQMTQKQLMAQLQTLGMDISAPALSLLEAQKRPVTDRELAILARVLEVSPLWLLGWEAPELPRPEPPPQP